MKILIEGYKYAANDVNDILVGLDFLENVKHEVVVNYVGYMYNPHIADCVFILPKVLVDKNDLAFGKYNPKDIIDVEKWSLKGDDDKLVKNEKDFIYEFAVWIYRCLWVFNNSNKKNEIIYYKQMSEVGGSSRHLSHTFLEILLALIDFNRKNQDFFMTILKNIHSGFNKINWTRTISHSQAVVQNGAPIYLNPVNKKRQINFDEELLIIFFSILKHINEKYGFPIKINIGFELITGARFEQYMLGYGEVRLRQIKYKYFSDKALYLWELCFAFFNKARNISVSSSLNEYLIAKNFNIVFESMIDELVGEKRENLPDGLKDQEDGKRVDHLYSYKGLSTTNDENKEVYYIGDSKYYGIGNAISEESVYKQYTYARNVIQYNMNLFLDKEDKTGCYCDEETEGYNVVPNFFISAKMDESLSYANDNIDVTDRKDKSFLNRHFKDRLFDRDTLLVCHYDVNFLYIISLYAQDNDYAKAEWKEKVRKIFREEIQKELKNRFDFYAMKSVGNPVAGEQFIRENFKELQGKIYRPYGDQTIYSLAIERPKDGQPTTESETYKLLKEYFVIEPVDLGYNPKEKLSNKVLKYQEEHPYEPIPNEWLPEYHIERYKDDYFVIGSYHNQAHWDWITGKNDRGSLIYNVRLDKNRAGAQVKSHIRQMKPKFAILYEEGHEADNKFHVFRIHDFAEMTEERIRTTDYPSEPHGDYFIFRFDDEVSIGHIDIKSLFENKSIEAGYVKGAPVYLRGSELIGYRYNVLTLND